MTSSFLSRDKCELSKARLTNMKSNVKNRIKSFKILLWKILIFLNMEQELLGIK